jgi:uncharacterized protein (TIGR00266 family)
MKTEILYQQAYAMTRVTLDPNEQIQAEGGTLVGMDPNISIKTGATGGFLRSLGRKMLGGESFFLNTFTADANGGELLTAPSLPGDMRVMQMADTSYLVQSGSYIASSMGIEVNTQWGGAKTFFGGEGLFMLRCKGSGTLVLSSYGAIHQMQLASGQRYTVDSGHIVAFPESMTYHLRRVGGWKSTLFSGEGIVVDLTGPGDVYLQTRSQDAFLSWLVPLIPHDNN